MTKRNADRVEDEREGQEISRDLGGGSLAHSPAEEGSTSARGFETDPRRPARTNNGQKDLAEVLCGAHRRRPPRPAATI